MNGKYWNLVETLKEHDQSILQENTRSEIWKKAYKLARKWAKKEIADLDKQLAAKKLKEERAKEMQARKLARQAEKKAAIAKRKADRAEARRKRMQKKS